MGQKVHPIHFRLGGIKRADSTWYAGRKDYADMLFTDHAVRKFLKAELVQAGVSKILIEREGPNRNARILITAARPASVIGRKGEDIDSLRKKVKLKMGVPVHVTVEEAKNPNIDSQIIADNIAQQLEGRVMFRRAMKRAVTNAMRLGAKGIKVCVAGRLGGTEIARTEWYREGRVPLHTLRADIDFGFSEAKTTYGIIGVKVWIFKGEVIGKTTEQRRAEEATAEESRG
jgi:small subunit ribosomal protein S3